MSFNPGKLKEAFNKHGGIARGHKYQALILGAPVTIPKDLQLMCETISLPTRSAATNELSMYGPVQSFPYRFTFTEASLNFYVTDDFAIKKLFDAWQEKIIDPVSGDVGYFDDYKCTIKISTFSDQDGGPVTRPKYSVTLIDAWPSIIGEIALGHSLGNELLKLPVTFQFRKWFDSTSGSTTGSPGRSSGPVDFISVDDIG